MKCVRGSLWSMRHRFADRLYSCRSNVKGADGAGSGTAGVVTTQAEGEGWTWTRGPYRTVFLQPGALHLHQPKSGQPPEAENRRQQKRDGADPGVVGVMVDVRDEEGAGEGDAPLPLTSRLVITLQPPNPDPDCVLDDVYSPSRQCDLLLQHPFGNDLVRGLESAQTQSLPSSGTLSISVSTVRKK